MNFPKQTIARVMFKLVQETEVSKRMLCMISNLNALKISLLAVEMLEVDLEIKNALKAFKKPDVDQVQNKVVKSKCSIM